MQRSDGWRIAALAAAAVCANVLAQPLPAGVILFHPDKVQWFSTARGGGQWAPIRGNPNHPGSYVYARKIPPRTITLAEVFPDARSYSVVSGTFYIGFGERYEEAGLLALPSGSYCVVPAGQPHFTATREQAVLLQVSGVGRSVPKPVDPPAR